MHAPDVSPERLTYPAVCLTQRSGVFVARGASDLEQCNGSLYWRARLSDGLQVIDASGTQYKVVDVKLVRPGTSWGRGLSRMLELSVVARPTLRPVGMASLETFRSRILAEIEEDPEFLEEMTGRTVPWWRDALARCTTSQELVQAFSAEDHLKQWQ